MERERREIGNFNDERLNRRYAVMAIDPYALGVDTSDPEDPKARLSYYSHQITHFAARLHKLGMATRIVAFDDATFGLKFPTTGALTALHLVEKNNIPSGLITIFPGKDQNQTAPQLKKLASYLKEHRLEQEPVLYPMWKYHQERVENHAEGFGVNVVTLPIEEVYSEIMGYDYSRLFDQLPLDEAEKMESFRRKVSRYDKKGYIPRLAKPILGGSYTIDNYRKPDGTLGFEYKPGKQKLKEVGLA